ncbi:MAG: FAD-binding protein, partial [Woeseiaceae bacterium]|nr:FAD-binding protein [Woeseiaceae bacterium]
HAPPDRSGETLLGMLQQAAEAAGADVLTEACVDGVYADAENRVRGVRIRRPDGDAESLGCAALVVATCGFGANREWVRRYLPGLAAARYYGHEGNTGDGIAWGMALGGAVADMGACQALGSLATPQSLVMPHTLMIGGGVQVNALGERFENELDNISGQALTILEQPEGICWIVYDHRLHEMALEGYREYRDGEAIGACRRAESWAALAAETGLPADRLEATMAAVDRHAASGEADAFGRAFEPSQRLRPPFYAVRVTGALFHTQGGLVTDVAARVLDADGTPLPNLFAGGGAARGLSGPAEWGYLPGMGLCTAVTLGRIAGRAAADLAKERRR